MKKNLEEIGNYTILQEVGHGISSYVYKAQKDDQLFAIKMFKPDYFQHLIDQEIYILEKLQNIEGFIQLIEILEDVDCKYSDDSIETNQCIVLEYAANDTLFDFLLDQKENLGEIELRTIFQKIITMIEQLHSLNLCHLDIKLDNILITDKFEIKLADFGYTKYFTNKWSKKIKLRRTVGTQSYMCPEIYSNQPYFGDSADIYSLGVVLYLLATKHFPYADQVTCRHFLCLQKNNLDEFWSLKKKEQKIDLSEDLKELVSQMLCYNPNNRITLNEIKQSKWFNQESSKSIARILLSN